MQDSACCDYFRTPVKFQGVDIYIFVGDVTGCRSEKKYSYAHIFQFRLMNIKLDISSNPPWR